jgi:hypothetical protein
VRLTTRWGFTVFTAFIACLIPFFGDLMGLIGESCLAVCEPACRIAEANRVQLVLLAFRIGHAVPIWQPYIGYSFQ